MTTQTKYENAYKMRKCLAYMYVLLLFFFISVTKIFDPLPEIFKFQYLT